MRRRRGVFWRRNESGRTEGLASADADADKDSGTDPDADIDSDAGAAVVTK